MSREMSRTEDGDTVTNQFMTNEKYRIFCETALDAKLPGLSGVDLLVLAGAIQNDPEYSARYQSLVDRWTAAKVSELGDNFLITPERFAMEAAENFSQQAAQGMCRAEKLLLRERLQAARKLPRE